MRAPAKRQTASVYLKELCDIGVLREVKAGAREAIHPNLMKLLTAEDHKVPEVLLRCFLKCGRRAARSTSTA